MLEQLSIECTECKHVFPLGKELRVVKHTSKVDGKILWFTMYDCPQCGESYVVQLDDANSKAILSDVKKSMARGMAYRSKNKHVPDGIKSKFDSKRAKLTRVRSALVLRYSGTEFVNDETGNDMVLKFTVC